MQCFLKSKCIIVEISMVKIGELLRKLRSLRSCFHILPPGALTPQGIEGAMKRDVSKHWCTLPWCASRGWYIAHENWTSWIRSIVLSNLSFIDTWSCCDTNRSHITSSTISKCIYWFFSNIDFQLRLFTHWGRDKTAAISKTTFSNVFSWMKIYEFRSRFHWSLFLRFKLTISQHWFR